MRNEEERLMKMHERAAELKRRKDLAGIRVMGAVSACLTVCLVIMIQQMQSLHHGILSTQIAGSSLLSDSVGGYVLVAVIAFFTGVIITVFIRKNRKKE